HGTLALIENGTPVIAIAPPGDIKVLGNIEEVKARGGFVIGFGDSKEGEEICDMFYQMPDIPRIVSPLVYSIPLQLLAYHMAVMLGRNPDKPRNLAKSVTVE
ncbi:MAG: SIS domain-containing protein, partial [Candidatus Altiarchaeota archaeon]|nr:SIS domain-containing protein [Candidatus Altiarchaeota archaeon]